MSNFLDLKPRTLVNIESRIGPSPMEILDPTTYLGAPAYWVMGPDGDKGIVKASEILKVISTPEPRIPVAYLITYEGEIHPDHEPLRSESEAKGVIFNRNSEEHAPYGYMPVYEAQMRRYAELLSKRDWVPKG